LSKELPARHKPQAIWSVDEIVEHERTGQAPESEEYERAAREHLAAGGFESDAREPDPKPLEEMTAEDHFDRIRRGG
jgi:hypothetical protein